MEEIGRVRTGAGDTVSEVDLSEPRDVRAYLEPGAGISASWPVPILVHFGDADFVRRYATFLENIPQWIQTAGRIESIDLRFERQAVVNPDQRSSAAPRSAAEATTARKQH
jgi:hypothetical protein